ncbi:MAG: UvrD-helicase domain-containing protein [Candidatus Paceibacterota bacterium]
MSKHLENLNDQQREAVLYKDSALLIIAGAGAGKTKTLTHRILHLIKEGVAPQNILAITFTNKAAKEMRDRVSKLLEEDRELNLPTSSFERPFVSTFHSLGVHILKENAELLNLSRHFTIFDKNDSRRAIKEAILSLNYDPKQWDAAKIQNVISREKGNMEDSDSYEEKNSHGYLGRVVSEVWSAYRRILKAEKALDFDDLLLETAKLLRDNKEVREHYQNIWQYVHIDEYQDTNKVQYLISKLIAEKHKNICVVGDIDQNIYSWRGANIKNILNFEKDYPDAKVIFLEENYRSTKTILEVANRIIEKNTMRRDKNLFTRNKEGEKIGVYQAYNENDEAEFVASKVQELMKQGVSTNEVAVLYRANFQSRVLEEAFLKYGVHYQLLGTKFFERKEVKDVLSYIKAAVNPDGLGDIKRIINVPARGIGKVTLIKIFAGQENTLTKAMKDRIADFRALLKKINEATNTMKPSDLVKFIIQESGMEEFLKKDKSVGDDDDRLENVRELATLAKKYDLMPMPDGVEKMLEESALASDQDELTENTKGVKLMTVHAAKGLEFEYVFITGLEDGLFPHKKINEDKITLEESEEERRLFYVALTRAKEKIFLSYASMRTIFGASQVNVPSEFIIDIDDRYLENEIKKIDFRGRDSRDDIDF